MSVIRFPTERRLQAAARTTAEAGPAAQTAPAAEPMPAGQPFAFVSMEIRQSIVKVQREVELEFHVFGAITAGSVSESGSGVALTTGAPEQVAARLREHAAPGQFLLSEPAWRTCEDTVKVEDTPIPVTIPGADPIPAYSLSDAT